MSKKNQQDEAQEFGIDVSFMNNNNPAVKPLSEDEMSKILSTLQAPVNEEVEFDEKDMEDPTLLEELDNIFEDKPLPQKPKPTINHQAPVSTKNIKSQQQLPPQQSRPTPQQQYKSPPSPRNHPSAPAPTQQRPVNQQSKVPREVYESLSIDNMPVQPVKRVQPPVYQPPVIVPLELKVGSDEENRKETIQTILTILQKQKIQANNGAAKARDNGEKQKSIILFKRMKAWEADIEKIKEIQSNNSIPPPIYHFEDLEIQTEVINDDLAIFDLEFIIQKATHIQAPPDQSKLNIYADCEFGFPDSNSPIKWRTSTISCNGPQFNPVFDHKKILRIERNTVLKRFIKSKKLNITLWASPKFFMWSSVCLGRVAVDLSELATTCTISTDIEIMDGRKSTGGTLSVQLRVRTPIENKEIKTESSRLLIIDKHYSLEDILNARLKNPPKQQNTPSAPTVSTTLSQPQPHSKINTITSPAPPQQSALHISEPNHSPAITGNGHINSPQPLQKQPVNHSNITTAGSLDDLDQPIPNKVTTTAPINDESDITQNKVITSKPTNELNIPSNKETTTPINEHIITQKTTVKPPEKTDHPTDETPVPMDIINPSNEDNISTDKTTSTTTITESPRKKEQEPPRTTAPGNPPPNQGAQKPGEVNLKLLKKKVQSLEWIVSNAVFEYEQKRLNHIISKLKAERKPSDEEETRLTLIAVKISDIVFRIQTEVLTLDAYTESVQSKITEERETAKILANAGDMETAKGCLARAKIMEKELAGEI